MQYPFDGTQSCYGQDTNLYYRNEDDKSREESRPLREMEVLCRTCELRDPCLDWALHHERDGFWSGTTEGQRDTLRRKLKIKVRPVQPEQFII
jgi:hypothetical protein